MPIDTTEQLLSLTRESTQATTLLAERTGDLEQEVRALGARVDGVVAQLGELVEQGRRREARELAAYQAEQATRAEDARAQAAAAAAEAAAREHSQEDRIETRRWLRQLATPEALGRAAWVVAQIAAVGGVGGLLTHWAESPPLAAPEPTEQHP